MKRTKKVIMMLVTMAASMISSFAEGLEKAPFTKGVNLTRWFENWTPTLPNLRRYSKQDFEDVKSLGCDVVRVPIHFNMLLEDEKTGKVKDVIFDYLDKACDWAEELGIYIIIDNHSFNGEKYPSSAKVADHLQKVWPQVAKRYSNRSKYVLYEILNEPQIPQEDWYKIQEDTLHLIRKYDKKRTVVVTGADWGGVDAMVGMQPYDDDNLIYTFHFYDPFVFTHQGASWSEKAIEDLDGIPFPYNKDKMPEVKASTKGSWVEGHLKYDYHNKGTEAALRAQIKKTYDFRQKYKVPVWCGEMGVYNLKAPEPDRTNWYKTVGSLFAEYKIPFTVWGYDGSFGIFRKGTPEVYPQDLNVEVIRGLGMKVPSDLSPRKKAKSVFPITIYDDFAGNNISFTSWGCDKYLSDYSKDKAEGGYCICMGDVNKYGALSVDISKLNLAELQGNKNAYVSFKIKFSDASQYFQLRFVDSDGKGENIPWRLAYDVKASDYKLKQWCNVEIPIAQMADVGGWSNITQKWYNSENAFDFSRVQSLEFCAEKDAIKGTILIDDIKIVVK